MKITISSIKKELKGMWNEVKVIQGLNITRVNFKNNQWMIVEEGEKFDDIAERGYKPTASFYTQDELAREMKIILNK